VEDGVAIRTRPSGDAAANGHEANVALVAVFDEFLDDLGCELGLALGDLSELQTRRRTARRRNDDLRLGLGTRRGGSVGGHVLGRGSREERGRRGQERAGCVFVTKTTEILSSARGLGSESLFLEQLPQILTLLATRSAAIGAIKEIGVRGGVAALAA